MPSWITHLVTANRLLDRIEVRDKNSFLFGNIMPDILNNYIVKETNTHREYNITHFTQDIIINGIEYEFPNPDKFLEEYKNKMQDSLICGYYIHLLTDYFWNKISYENYFRKKDGRIEVKFINGDIKQHEFDSAIRIKQTDFAIYTTFLKNNNMLERIHYSNKILLSSNQIREIPLTQKDIEKTLWEVDKFIYEEKVNEQEEYKLFTQDVLNQYFEECVEYIVENINKVIQK